MKVAIIGGTGLLGKAIAQEWTGDALILAGSRDVDVRDPARVAQFIRTHRPEWVLLAAAMADVDGCERDPQQAEAVNHLGAIHVAEACRSAKSRLMYISTDYVFGGTSQRTPLEVDDEVAPNCVYARTKTEAERSVRRILPSACVARVSWLFGAEGRCFANTALEWAESGRPIRAITDQHGVPNYNHDVGRALMLLVRAGATGIVHVSNPGGTTWYDFTKEMLAVAGIDAVVEPITAKDLQRPAPRPAYSVLSDSSLRAYGITMRHWREAVPGFLEARKTLRKSAAPAPL
jgi:dTDP-4-dehydrorhamnose reductase